MRIDTMVHIMAKAYLVGVKKTQERPPLTDFSPNGH